MKVIDLFAGAGGFSTGAVLAGCEVVWAANHWPEAVRYHQKNHPDAEHVTQDLHQADWGQVPGHDMILASPCCQGHSRARGKEHGNPQHDASRATAWAVVSAVEFHRPPVVIVENVPEFTRWSLYPAWKMAMESLGYSVSPHALDAAYLGAPQNRVRLFLVMTKTKSPLHLDLPKYDPIPASSFIHFGGGRWSKVDRPGRAKATLERVAAGRKEHGEQFLISYYGNSRGGRSLDRPIGTITTRDRWAVIDGDRMRMLSRDEVRDAMTFPKEYKLPKQHRLSVHMLGNAVCPVPAARIIEAVMEAA